MGNLLGCERDRDRGYDGTSRAWAQPDNLALSEVAGAFQRLSVILGFAWTAFVAHHLMRSLPE